MLIEDYYALVAVDLPPIRRDRVDADAAQQPALHDKYLRFLIEEQKVLKTMERAMDRLKLAKSQYYLGKADPEIYKTKLYNGKIFNLVLLKSDLPLYLAADEEMQAAGELIDSQKYKVEYLKKTLDELNRRGFLRDNIIKSQRIKFGLDSMNIDTSALDEESFRGPKLIRAAPVVIEEDEERDEEE